MVETGHPGAGAYGGARRTSASAGTEAGARSEGLWGCGGGVQSPAAVLAERKALLCDDRLLGKFMTSSRLPLEGDRNGED